MHPKAHPIRAISVFACIVFPVLCLADESVLNPEPAAPEPGIPMLDEPGFTEEIADAPVAAAVVFPEEDMSGAAPDTVPDEGVEAFATEAAPPAIHVLGPTPSNGQERISITLADVELAEAVSLFIRLSGANIITSPGDLVGRVTVSLTDVLWHEALNSILDLHGLVLERTSLDADLYKIVPRPEGAPEPMFIESFHLKFSRPDPLVPGIRSLLAPNGQLLFAEGNIISILGTTRQVERVRGMIDRVDQRVPQVVIEAKFVELDDSAIRRLGVNWQSLDGYTAVVQPGGSLTRTDVRTRVDQNAFARPRRPVGDSGWEPIPRAGFGIQGENIDTVDFGDGTMSMVPRREDVTTRSYSAVLTADQFSVTLSALRREVGAGIISNPRIIVTSGQKATIHVGERDPEIKAVADTNLGGRLTYQREGWIESGVMLEVTPVVNTEDIISVQIRPELSRIAGYIETGDARVTIPRLRTREIHSQFQVPSGRTVAIGGLTETSEDNAITKVPILGDIPLLGRLFRHESRERKQTEIIIFVSLALAETDMLEQSSGIPSQSQMIYRGVETDDDGVMTFVQPEWTRGGRRRSPDPNRLVPRH